MTPTAVQWWCGQPTTDGLGSILPAGHSTEFRFTRPKWHLSIAQQDDGVTLPVSPERAAMFPPDTEENFS